MSKAKTFALITGANSGIGYEIGRQLLAANEGYHVLIGARSLEKGQEAVKKLQETSPDVELIQLDVTKEDSITEAARIVQEKHGRLDVLVNNAGIARAPGTPGEEMIEVFRVNAVGTELCTQAFAPLLKLSSSPRIVNITSGAGSIGNCLDPNGRGHGMRVLAYRMSKAAQNMSFAVQCVDFAKDGFKLFLYGPGPTISTMNAGAIASMPDIHFKPTSVGAEPAVDMIRGKRDQDIGKYIEYGEENFPW